MKERPILFSGPMVTAILEGRKTQTRRVVKWKPRVPGLNFQATTLQAGDYFTGKPEHGQVLRSRDGRGSWNDRTYPVQCPYGKVGDRLWVRETHATVAIPNGTTANEFMTVYRADNPHGMMLPKKWKPSIFMRPHDSRINLEITGVRVERLQDISSGDIEAEGVLACDEWRNYLDTWESMQSDDCSLETPHQYWERRWNRINGKKYPWASNPWVWVVEFRRV